MYMYIPRVGHTSGRSYGQSWLFCITHTPTAAHLGWKEHDRRQVMLAVSLAGFPSFGTDSADAPNLTRLNSTAQHSTAQLGSSRAG